MDGNASKMIRALSPLGGTALALLSFLAADDVDRADSLKDLVILGHQLVGGRNVSLQSLQAGVPGVDYAPLVSALRQ